MKIIDRFILALYSVAIAIISSFVIILPFNIPNMINTRKSIELIQSIQGNYLYSLIGLIFFLISIRFLFSGIIDNKDRQNQSFLVMTNEYGEIVVYSQTIVGLVQNIVNEFDEIKNINTGVNLCNEQIQILMKGEVLPDVNIPEITKRLQIKVKKCLENATGAKVGDIKVEIHNISKATRVVR